MQSLQRGNDIECKTQSMQEPVKMIKHVELEHSALVIGRDGDKVQFNSIILVIQCGYRRKNHLRVINCGETFWWDTK